MKRMVSRLLAAALAISLTVLPAGAAYADVPSRQRPGGGGPKGRGRYFLRYQDGRSVETALCAAKLLGVTGVSLWRLGTIPQYTFTIEPDQYNYTWNWDGLLD